MMPTGQKYDGMHWELIGNSAAMQELRRPIGHIASRDATVIIRGETGTGKELVARHIHKHSARADKPFMVIDCAALRDTLLESQLFGHIRGAFTDACSDAVGALRAADGGVLFLDELGELDLAAQAKLLRCLQERAVTPLGAVKPIPVDFRILAATHRDLEAMIQDGQFREDLYFRLNVLTVQLPPLRDRREDIQCLLTYFLQQIGGRYGETALQFDPCAMTALLSYHWPGNVRELANVAEHVAAVAATGKAGLEHLPENIRCRMFCQVSSAIIHLIPLDQAQRDLVDMALRATNGHVGQAAALLQIDRRRFSRMARRYGLRG